jgi:hypothetical protein
MDSILYNASWNSKVDYNIHNRNMEILAHSAMNGFNLSLRTEGTELCCGMPLIILRNPGETAARHNRVQK